MSLLIALRMFWLRVYTIGMMFSERRDDGGWSEEGEVVDVDNDGNEEVVDVDCGFWFLFCWAV